MLGEVPYLAILFGPADKDEERAPAVEVAILAEPLPGEITSSIATSSFDVGTRFPCKWGGERHSTDGRRLMRPCDENTGDLA